MTEVGFRQKGYLWLCDDETWPKACEHLELQRSLGHPIEPLTPAEVNRRVPEIDRLEGLAGATFSPSDGLINPNLLKEHYRARSTRTGRRLPRSRLRPSGGASTRMKCVCNAGTRDQALSDAAWSG